MPIEVVVELHHERELVDDLWQFEAVRLDLREVKGVNARGAVDVAEEPAVVVASWNLRSVGEVLIGIERGRVPARKTHEWRREGAAADDRRGGLGDRLFLLVVRGLLGLVGLVGRLLGHLLGLVGRLVLLGSSVGDRCGVIVVIAAADEDKPRRANPCFRTGAQ